MWAIIISPLLCYPIQAGFFAILEHTTLTHMLSPTVIPNPPGRNVFPMFLQLQILPFPVRFPSTMSSFGDLSGHSDLPLLLLYHLHSHFLSLYIRYSNMQSSNCFPCIHVTFIAKYQHRHCPDVGLMGQTLNNGNSKQVLIYFFVNILKGVAVHLTE